MPGFNGTGPPGRENIFGRGRRFFRKRFFSGGGFRSRRGGRRFICNRRFW